MTRTIKEGNAAATALRMDELSKELDVPAHVLRFWEAKFPQIKSMKRGSGRRYYRPEDISLLKGVQAMLHVDGYSIKGVQKALREQGVQVAAERAERTSSAAVAADAPTVPPVKEVFKAIDALKDARTALQDQDDHAVVERLEDAPVADSDDGVGSAEVIVISDEIVDLSVSGNVIRNNKNPSRLQKFGWRALYEKAHSEKD